MAWEEVSRPPITVNREATLFVVASEEQEGRDIATCNIQNTFIETGVEGSVVKTIAP